MGFESHTSAARTTLRYESERSWGLGPRSPAHHCCRDHSGVLLGPDVGVLAQTGLVRSPARAVAFVPVTVPDAAAMRLANAVLAPAGSDIVLAEWTAEGSADGARVYQAPLHEHPEAEAWYVLDGVLGVRIGDADVEVPAGGAVVVPGGTAHTFWNRHPQPVRYVLVMGARTHALVEAIHASDDRSVGAMRRLFEEHGAALLEE